MKKWKILEKNVEICKSEPIIIMMNKKVISLYLALMEATLLWTYVQSQSEFHI